MLSSRSRKFGIAVVLLCVLGAGITVAAPILEDNFDDNARGDIWYQIEARSSAVRLDEVNQRLELLSAQDSDLQSAQYVLRERRLDTSQNFTMQVDWQFTKTAGTNSKVMLSLASWKSAPFGIAAGWSATSGAYFTVGGLAAVGTIARAATSGTLYISYDSALDKLYLSVNDYYLPASSNGDWVADGLIHGALHADMLVVSIGGKADGVALVSGDAYLDNFAIMSGALLTPPARTLRVQSSPQGADVKVRPEDNDGNSDGTANFTRVYDLGIPVVLTASSKLIVDDKTLVFRNWVLNNRAKPHKYSVKIVMSQDNTALAMYRRVKKLKITGPRAVTAGETAEYVCRAYYTNGTSEDVTQFASWRVTARWATIEGPGLLKGKNVTHRHITQILTKYGGKVGHYLVLIKPAH